MGHSGLYTMADIRSVTLVPLHSAWTYFLPPELRVQGHLHPYHDHCSMRCSSLSLASCITHHTSAMSFRHICSHLHSCTHLVSEYLLQCNVCQRCVDLKSYRSQTTTALPQELWDTRRALLCMSAPQPSGQSCQLNAHDGVDRHPHTPTAMPFRLNAAQPFDQSRPQNARVTMCIPAGRMRSHNAL